VTPAERRERFARWQAYREGWLQGTHAATFFPPLPIDGDGVFGVDLTDGYRDGWAARQEAFAKARERYGVEEGE